MSRNGKGLELSPQQEAFLSFYIDPFKTDTFGNAYQSALAAGYKETYAKNIMDELPDWLRDNTGDLSMLRKAERNIDQFLDMDTETVLKVLPEGDVIRGQEPQLVRIKQDTSKFVAERIGKNRWSQRTEITGKDGKDLMTKEAVDSSLDNLK